MALRIEKAFGVKMIRLCAASPLDIAQTRKREGKSTYVVFINCPRVMAPRQLGGY